MFDQNQITIYPMMIYYYQGVDDETNENMLIKHTITGKSPELSR